MIHNSSSAVMSNTCPEVTTRTEGNAERAASSVAMQHAACSMTSRPAVKTPLSFSLVFTGHYFLIQARRQVAVVCAAARTVKWCQTNHRQSLMVTLSLAASITGSKMLRVTDAGKIPEPLN